ncbi:hypothetical protein KQX54_001679 [Cotesia glomerata]|uniref:Uncharacterized protein n=1 Tax=Cotesia glomerata TaxID=32391 RepID=A0AAV7IZ74_COTGL|nr:hypothetical protein KQX54_001679 [Cotesia glomerata]
MKTGHALPIGVCFFIRLRHAKTMRPLAPNRCRLVFSCHADRFRSKPSEKKKETEEATPFSAHCPPRRSFYRRSRRQGTRLARKVECRCNEDFSPALFHILSEIHHLQYLGCSLCSVQVDQLASNRSAKIGSLALDVDGELAEAYQRCRILSASERTNTLPVEQNVNVDVDDSFSLEHSRTGGFVQKSQMLLVNAG